ncbi:LytR/AlgR family response regulator transcription factor [Mucilaginibacter phyllosphaerae]|uniref:DNA-binding LytR/AlgR family response regulator n=1 Tax=Mucilaginibacter phyllosphaerae TaxID=1812349 RepID=A0A4Y8AHI6_9SPHI|nr:LytTR family DNA-binding domain-containing protein [Mucilaginibacter phyllosphaerae]MBB3968733.1 DNA-binding LytR/AlgR family response regulator [Mucilaginibacter phyllosphaerae]TEW67631.1 response regulator transcription factor [Mucilaginibacter phyllosphaerae]GGH14200.1 DNA-binding response regulator [Mucilaginibacter phyllosphaerae]
MKCIIVDDEPLAREAIQLLIDKTPGLEVLQSFGSAGSAALFLKDHTADLVFLDIEMPGMNGIEFSKTIPKNTLVIFTTAYAEYALDSYEVEAVDYLIKPIQTERFGKAINKAAAYQALLKGAVKDNPVGNFADGYFFVKAERMYVKIYFKDILFIEGLKDYVVLQTESQKVITAMNIKTIYEQLPQNIFVRISRSYIINVQHINSFDNNTVLISKHEIPIGNTYRTHFFEEFVIKKTLSK